MLTFKYNGIELGEKHLKKELNNSDWQDFEPIAVGYLDYSDYFTIETNEEETILENSYTLYSSTIPLNENSDGTFFTKIGTDTNFRLFNRDIGKDVNRDRNYYVSFFIRYKTKDNVEENIYLCHTIKLKVTDEYDVSHLVSTFRVDSYYRPFFFNAALLLFPKEKDIVYIVKEKKGSGEDEYDEYSIATKNGNSYTTYIDDNKFSLNYCRFYCAISNGCSINDGDKHCIGNGSLNISQGTERKNVYFSSLYRRMEEILTPPAVVDQKTYEMQEIRIANCYGDEKVTCLKEGTYDYDFATGNINDNTANDVIYPMAKTLKLGEEYVNNEYITIDTSDIRGISARFSVKEGYPTNMEEAADEAESFYNGIKFYDYIGRVVEKTNGAYNLTNKDIIAYGNTSSRCRYFACDINDIKNILLSLNGNVIDDNFFYERAINSNISGTTAWSDNKFYKSNGGSGMTCGINTREIYFNENNKNSSWYGPLTRKGSAGQGGGDWSLFRNEITEDLKNGTYTNSRDSIYIIGICDPYTELDDDILNNEYNDKWCHVYKHTSRLSIVKIYKIKEN